MARPSKEELEKRNSIENLYLFRRDNEIYLQFEKNSSHSEMKMKIPYHFAKECNHRSSIEVYADRCQLAYNLVKGFSFDDIPLPFLDKVGDKGSSELIKKFKRLHKIDTEIFKYYFLISNEILFPVKNELMGTCDIEEPYYIKNMIDNSVLEILFGKERADILTDSRSSVDLSIISSLLAKEEKKSLLLYLEGFQFGLKPVRPFYTHIYDHSKNNSMTCGLPSKSVFVELDFTKPVEEIIEFVTMLKNNYQENKEPFKNVYDLLDIEEKNDDNALMIDLKNNDIYIEREPKPMQGRLADMLFIYDCRRAGLTNEYIIGEIFRYWCDVESIYHEEGMEVKTVRKYYKFIDEYMKTEKYKLFLSGSKEVVSEPRVSLEEELFPDFDYDDGAYVYPSKDSWY